MNNAQLNGEPFGAAAASAFITMSGTFTSYATSSTLGVYVIQHIVENQSCANTHTLTLKIYQQCAAAMEALASAVVTVTNYVGKYASSSVTASGTGVLTSVRRQYASFAETAEASVDAAFAKAITWAATLTCGASANAIGTVYFSAASSITSSATSTFNWDTTGYHASPDRTMVVPAEDRTMAVT